MNYPLMNNPYVTFPICEMKKKQVDLCFEWFMAHKDERVEQLQRFINNETNKVILDYSVESLIPLWEWFENHIEFEPRTPEEIEEDVASRPQWMHETVRQYTEKETLMTMALAYDISIYFGDTIVKNNPQLYWEYPRKPKKLDGVNEPNILGFGTSLNLYLLGVLSVLVKKSHREKDKNRLYNLYEIQMKLLPNNK